MSVKQIIVVRKDLKMGRGKIASQASHASMAAVIMPEDYILDEYDISEKTLTTHMVDDYLKEWLNGSFVKVCLSCDSEEELIEMYHLAKEKGIRRSLIKDEGRTCFKGVPTYTCLALGPYDSEIIDEITGSLKLLN